MKKKDNKSEPETKGDKVALLNGTFDTLHKGHRRYLKHAFNQASYIYIFLASDKFAKEVKNQFDVIPYSKRKKELKKYLSLIKNGHKYEIKCVDSLNEFKQFCIEKKELDIVFAAEPKYIDLFLECQKERKRRKIKEFEIKKINLIKAKNGEKISSTTINSCFCKDFVSFTKGFFILLSSRPYQFKMKAKRPYSYIIDLQTLLLKSISETYYKFYKLYHRFFHSRHSIFIPELIHHNFLKNKL